MHFKIVSKLLKVLKRANFGTHNPLVLGSSPSGPIIKSKSYDPGLRAHSSSKCDSHFYIAEKTLLGAFCTLNIFEGTGSF